MIQYIIGKLADISENEIVIDHQGMGFRISVPGSILSQLPAMGHEVKIYTYLHVREDILQLYGFFSQDDLAMFCQLIKVSGIGPKGGLAILSVMSADDLRFAIVAGDAKTISAAPGIGKKTAEKLILEMKDKIDMKDSVENMLQQGAKTSGKQNKEQEKEAIEALTALGYTPSEALKAVSEVPMDDISTVEDLLKYSLKNL
jgi:Holliday junction DNA helicase RuvA